MSSKNLIQTKYFDEDQSTHDCVFNVEAVVTACAKLFPDGTPYTFVSLSNHQYIKLDLPIDLIQIPE